MYAYLSYFGYKAGAATMNGFWREMKNLGKDYIVWDKAADIQFKSPGKGKLTAHFNITQQQLAEIKAAADKNYKVEPRFKVEVKDEQGNVVAEVDKLLYVRRKDRKPPAPKPPKS